MNVAQAVARIRPSIVQVRFQASDLTGELHEQVGAPFVSRPIGTGFFVSLDAHLITARHVIEGGRDLCERMDARRKHILVGLPHPNTENMRGNFTLVNFDVVDEDAAHDLALLKLTRNPFKGEVRSGFVIGNEEIPLSVNSTNLRSDRPVDGADIAISGYPLSEPVLVTSAGWMATSWSFDIKAVTALDAQTSLAGLTVEDSFLADVRANGGNSGGPVYLTEDSSVIGVCVELKGAPVWDQTGQAAVVGGQQLFYSSGLTQVVPARYVIDLLKKHGVHPAEPAQ